MKGTPILSSPDHAGRLWGSLPSLMAPESDC
jgi:hypothetical protein